MDTLPPRPGMIPGTDPGAPPPRAPDWQPADDQPAVEPGAKPRPVSNVTSPPKPIPQTKWSEVIAKPQYQGLSPEQKETVRNQYWDQVVVPQIPPNMAPDQKVLLRKAFDQDTLPKDGPQASGGSVGKVLDHALAAGNQFGLAETAMHVGSQIAALPVEAAASLYKLATAPSGLKAKEAAEASQAVGEALTYQPRTPEGQRQAAVVDAVGGVVPKVAEWATGDIAEDPTLKRVLGPTGSAALQGAANTTVQALPTLLGARAGKAVATEAGAAATAARAASAATRAAEGLKRARAYVAKETSLDWDKIPEPLRKKLTDIAEDDPDALFRLKPKAIERQANLEKLKVPATRGQVERDVPQLTREENLSKQEGPLQEISDAQDVALHRQLDVVRRSTGAKAVTREQVGKTVQNDALRNKAAVSKKNYDTKYKIARATEPNAATSPAALYDLLEKNPEIQHLGFVSSWLKKAKVMVEAEGEGAPIALDTDVGKALADRGKAKGESLQMRDVKLSELEDLRKKASGIARRGGDNAYYAGEVVKAINEAFEKIPAAAKAWKAARDAYKEHQIEFEDQALVKELVGSKSRATRNTPLEDTVTKVVSRSSESIAQLKKTLLEGGTDATRAAGKRAWANLQAGVVDLLKEKAAGKRAIPGSKGQLPFDSTYRDLFAELDKDGKIDVLFGPKQAKRLREVHEAAGDVRTKPKGRISGSDTAARQALSKAEKLSVVPKVGTAIAGVAKGLGKVSDMGKSARESARAKSSALDDAAKKAAKRNKARGRGRYTLKSIQASGAAHRATLKDDDKRDDALK